MEEERAGSGTSAPGKSKNGWRRSLGKLGNGISKKLPSMRRGGSGASNGSTPRQRAQSSLSSETQPPVLTEAEQRQQQAMDDVVLRAVAPFMVFTGVSVRWLVAFASGLADGTVAPGVELVQARQALADDVPKGTSLEVLEAGVGRASGRASSETVSFRDDQVRRVPRSQWTVRDVGAFFVAPALAAERRAPRTASGKAKARCFVDTLSLGKGKGKGKGRGRGMGRDDEEDDDRVVGEEFEGSYVSVAHGCIFADLVNTLELHYRVEGDGDSGDSGDSDEEEDAGAEVRDDAFVWLDVLCADQLPAAGGAVRAEATEAEALHAAMARFDSRMFYLDAWERPALLRRLRCVWELLGAIDSGLTLDMLLAHGQDDRFLQQLMDDPESVMTAHVDDVDVKDAACADPGAGAMLSAKVEKKGWERLAKLVLRQRQAWLLYLTEDAVKRMDRGASSVTASESYARLLNNAGWVMQQSGQRQVALSYFLRAVDVSVEIYSEVHVDVATALNSLGDLYLQLHRPDDALAAFARSVGIMKKLTDSDDRDHPSVLETLAKMAGLHSEKGEHAAAIKLLKRSCKIVSTAGDDASQDAEDAARLGPIYLQMGLVYDASGDQDKALDHFQRAYHLLLEGRGEHPETGKALGNLASSLQKRGEFERALDAYERAAEVLKRAHGTDQHPDIAITIYNCARVLEKMGRIAEAIQHANKARDIFSATLGPDHANTIMANKKIAALAP